MAVGERRPRGARAPLGDGARGPSYESHATAVATQIRTGATISGLHWPGENPLDVNDFERRRFDRACEPFKVTLSK